MSRLIVLLPLLFLDVRVRAADVVISAERRRTVAIDQAQLTLAAGGLAVETSAGVRFVRGRAYVEGAARIVTPFATLTCAERTCRALLHRAADSVTLEALSPGWRVRRTGDLIELSVAEATRVRVGEVDRAGEAALEPPQALAWAPLVRQWADLYPREASDFLEVVRRFRPAWAAAVERLSEDQAGRALAMVRADARAKAAEESRRLTRAAEDAEIRRRFHEMNQAD